MDTTTRFRARLRVAAILRSTSHDERALAEHEREIQRERNLEAEKTARNDALTRFDLEALPRLRAFAQELNHKVYLTVPESDDGNRVYALAFGGGRSLEAMLLVAARSEEGQIRIEISTTGPHVDDDPSVGRESANQVQQGFTLSTFESAPAQWIEWLENELVQQFCQYEEHFRTAQH